MKSKDIGTLVVVGIVSAGFALFLSSWLLSSTGAKNQEAEIVEEITSTFERPPKQYFNSDSINPTQEIQIRQDENSNPFNN
jgi:hypothetical protein